MCGVLADAGDLVSGVADGNLATDPAGSGGAEDDVGEYAVEGVP